MIRRLFEPVRGALWGWAVTVLLFLVLMAMEIALQALDLKLNLKTYSWLCAVCVGGYFACRQAKTLLWLNWTVFAVLLELLAITQIPEANKTLSELYPDADPDTIQWHFPTMLVLTIPAALTGALARVFGSKDAKAPSAVNNVASGP